MGAGYHGGFGATKGSGSVIAADSTLVGNGKGFQLKEAAKRVKKLDGYTDVAVHGSPDSISVMINKNGKEREIVYPVMSRSIFHCARTIHTENHRMSAKA